MNKINTPFDTLACDGRQGKLKEITRDVEEALIRGGTVSSGSLTKMDNPNVHVLVDLIGAGAAIPAFIHPIFVNRDGQEIVVVDGRPFVRYEKTSGEYSVKNLSELHYRILYGGLSYNWKNGNRQAMLNVTSAPTSLFSKWISESIKQRLAVTAFEQLNIAILSALYFQALFCVTNDDDEIPDATLNGIAVTAAKATRVQTNEVFRVIDDNDIKLPITGISDFCNVMAQTMDTVRLKDMSAALIFHIIGSSWYGEGSMELMAVATEFPPLWLALLATAANNRAYNRTVIGQLVARNNSQETSMMVMAILKVGGFSTI